MAKDESYCPFALSVFLEWLKLMPTGKKKARAEKRRRKVLGR